MAYALLSGKKYHSSRQNGPVLGIVLHITAGLQDLGMQGADGSAEGTARWAINSGAKVSWHVGVDSDSVVPCLPDTYTAWHAKGYNSRTYGIEISKLDVDWSDVPDVWVERTLRHAAEALAPIVRKYKLPLVRATKAQVDAAVASGRPFGFTYHSFTSAGTRSDPGKNFPFDRLIALIRAELGGAPAKPAAIPSAGRLVVDGRFGPASAAELKKWMKRYYLSGVDLDRAWDSTDAKYLEYILNHLAAEQGWAKVPTNGTTEPGATNIHTGRLRWLVGVSPAKGGWTPATTLALQKFLNKKNGF
ncbi:MAG: N-acetylmuramoyl-L-alanine amidase [Nocardioides sp.]